MSTFTTSGWRDALALLRQAQRWFVLTGAGCSTESGIPSYRDAAGQWQHPQPIQWQEFSNNVDARRRYWLRSMASWPRFSTAEPNATHMALAAIQRQRRLHQLVTQNVDGLHQRAGSRGVIDLHGSIEQVQCMGCGRRDRRSLFQDRLTKLNPQTSFNNAPPLPDGDAAIDDQGRKLHIPDCPHCGGTIRPNVVFFGENVPRARVEFASQRLAESDLALVIGSSLKVFSGFRFARAAHAAGKPLVILNRGMTRADAIATQRIDGSCGELLPRLVAELSTDLTV